MSFVKSLVMKVGLDSPPPLNGQSEIVENFEIANAARVRLEGEIRGEMLCLLFK
jgi:hypothetical protein